MKNLASICLLLLSFTIFSCEKPNGPQPEPGSGTPTMAGFESDPNANTAGMQIGNTVPKRKPSINQFEWKHVKTATIPLYKGLQLTSPFAIVGEHEGDISWGQGGGCYNAVNTEKMPFAILGIVDVNTLTTAYLNSLTLYTKGGASWAPANSPWWKNYIPEGGVLAYKTPQGKFILVMIKSSSPLTLDIYHEHYYMIN